MDFSSLSKFRKHYLTPFGGYFRLETGMISSYNIPPKVLQLFLLTVRSQYAPHPFHNWRHAVAVMQYSYLFMRRTRARHFVEKLDVFALLIASLCHDIRHPGNTNSFEIQTCSDLGKSQSDSFARVSFTLLCINFVLFVSTKVSKKPSNSIKISCFQKCYGSDLSSRRHDVSLLMFHCTIWILCCTCVVSICMWLVV